jgi:hypothetical protein
MTSRISRHRKR